MVESARPRLLEAALRAVAERGPSGLTTQAVADEAGVSKALVHYHFRTRQGLLDALAAWLLEDTRAGLVRLIEDYPNPRRRLHALVETLLGDPVGEPAEAVRNVLLFWLEGPHGERLALLRAFIEETVREGAATGALRRGVDPPTVADPLLADWLGATAMRASGDPVDMALLRERALRRLAEQVEPPA